MDQPTRHTAPTQPVAQVAVPLGLTAMVGFPAMLIELTKSLVAWL